MRSNASTPSAGAPGRSASAGQSSPSKVEDGGLGMNRFLKAGPVLLLLACAPCAWAQGEGAPKGGEVVRERRVAAEAPREETGHAPDVAAEASSEETEALRAKAEAATNPAERARLRLSLAES